MMAMTKEIGIDLGTANTLIYLKGKGIVLHEPSVVAADMRTMAVLEVGDAANLMFGKTSGDVQAYRPLQDGVIADFDVTAAMLRQFIKKVVGSTLLNRPKVAMCIPYGVTGVERRAVEDAPLEAGAKSVALIEEPIAAAIGAGIKIGAPRGNFIVDIGGGTTEVAVISIGGIVLSKSIRVAGNKLDEAIVLYIKRKYNVSISPKTAEMLKMRIGSVHPSTDGGALDIRGKNLLTGLPVTLHISSGEVREAMTDQLIQIIDCIKSTLERTPPELSSDIYDRGIVIAGGGACLRGIPQLITAATGLRAFVADMPINCVVNGLGKFLEHPETYPYLAKYRAR